MGWSLKMGRIAGIQIYLHLTFLLFIVWIALMHWMRSRDVSYALVGAGFVIALFGCVLLHELGHALAARKYGIPTRDITLLPIGGVARLERMPEEPRQELWVAIAGPLVNVVIAAVLFVWLSITASWQPIEQLDVARGGFAQRLMVVNLFLVLFNLLPAFPMDGGRILRALLAMKMDYARATQIAANVGQAMALLFGFAGLFGNPMLLFIAFFVWIGAAQEASATQMRSALGGVPVLRAMQTHIHALSPEQPLSRAVELILAGSQVDFPVVDATGHVVGILTQEDLMVALANQDVSAPVGSVMRRDFTTADAYEMLEPALTRLAQTGCRSAPVLRSGVLVGLLTQDNIGEYVMIQSALRQRMGERIGAGSSN